MRSTMYDASTLRSKRSGGAIGISATTTPRANPRTGAAWRAQAAIRQHPFEQQRKHDAIGAEREIHGQHAGGEVCPSPAIPRAAHQANAREHDSDHARKESRLRATKCCQPAPVEQVVAPDADVAGRGRAVGGHIHGLTIAGLLTVGEIRQRIERDHGEAVTAAATNPVNNRRRRSFATVGHSMAMTTPRKARTAGRNRCRTATARRARQPPRQQGALPLRRRHGATTTGRTASTTQASRQILKSESQCPLT